MPSLRPPRRVRRLAIAGTVWALFLILAPGFLLRDADAERSGLPDLPPAPWTSHEDARLSRIVEYLAGEGAAVFCWSSDDWEKRRDPWNGHEPRWSGPWGAYVSTEPDNVMVNLAPNECRNLKLLMGSKTPVWRHEHPSALAWSVHVLAHESVHVAGHEDETKAECWAHQLVPLAARRLGRTRGEGRYLARIAWMRWYPQAPLSYRSPDCRDGGRLDLHPKSHVWP